MRILGMTVKWQKLVDEKFTTFRYKRRDRDWEEGETVQVVFRPRSKTREVLGVARIIAKERRCLFLTEPGVPVVTNQEAIADGFADLNAMFKWMLKAHRGRGPQTLNKLTLRWEKKQCLVRTEF